MLDNSLINFKLGPMLIQGLKGVRHVKEIGLVIGRPLYEVRKRGAI